MNLFEKEIINWKLEDIIELIEKYKFENLHFDFKEKLPDNDSLIKLVSSFANTDGGIIFFGIKDKTFEIVGLDKNLEFRKEFNDKIKSIVPMINFDCCEIDIPDSDKKIYGILIKKSDLAPHLSKDSINNNSNHGLFYKRTVGGESISMNYMDLRNAFVNYQQRKSRLNQLYIELLFNRNVAKSNINFKGKSNNFSLYKFKLSVFDNILADSYFLFENDKNLLDHFLLLRERFNVAQSLEQRIFFYTTVPITNNSEQLKIHNDELGIVSEKIESEITKILSILDKKYELKNPLK